MNNPLESQPLAADWCFTSVWTAGYYAANAPRPDPDLPAGVDDLLPLMVEVGRRMDDRGLTGRVFFF